jgi:Cdc6-like AAA superfamily ATPase
MLDPVSAGMPHLVLVEGPAGIGKTTAVAAGVSDVRRVAGAGDWVDLWVGDAPVVVGVQGQGY